MLESHMFSVWNPLLKQFSYFAVTKFHRCHWFKSTKICLHFVWVCNVTEIEFHKRKTDGTRTRLTFNKAIPLKKKKPNVCVCMFTFGIIWFDVKCLWFVKCLVWWLKIEQFRHFQIDWTQFRCLDYQKYTQIYIELRPFFAHEIPHHAWRS